MTQSLTYRKMLTRMGYYNYQNGLIYRHLNQQGGWDHHQELCRRFIIKALDFFKPEKVTVLGSGWLLDLPFIEIVERTSKVCLIDIIHPPDVVEQCVSFNNVELVKQDITGGLIEDVWQDRHKYSFLNKLKSLKKYNIPEYKPVGDPGMVISLNILTQLEAMLIRFLKRGSGINEDESNHFRAEIQTNHINFLKKHKSVLITDYSEVITDKSGNIKMEPTLLTELPQSHFKEEWTWDFDLTGADLHNSRSQFKIVALII